VQVAHIEIDPVQLEEYRVAVRKQITAVIRDESGVLVLDEVSDRTIPLVSRCLRAIVMRTRTKRTSPLLISRNIGRQPKRW
jgi:DNA-binding NtrC family response regulator